jgi:hypothetical protein
MCAREDLERKVHPCTRVPKSAMHCARVTLSLAVTAFLHGGHAHKGDDDRVKRPPILADCHRLHY